MKTAVLGVGTVHGFVCVSPKTVFNVVRMLSYPLQNLYVVMLREGRNPVANELLAYR